MATDATPSELATRRFSRRDLLISTGAGAITVAGGVVGLRAAYEAGRAAGERDGSGRGPKLIGPAANFRRDWRSGSQTGGARISVTAIAEHPDRFSERTTLFVAQNIGFTDAAEGVPIHGYVGLQNVVRDGRHRMEFRTSLFAPHGAVQLWNERIGADATDVELGDHEGEFSAVAVPIDAFGDHPDAYAVTYVIERIAPAAYRSSCLDLESGKALAEIVFTVPERITGLIEDGTFAEVFGGSGYDVPAVSAQPAHEQIEVTFKDFRFDVGGEITSWVNDVNEVVNPSGIGDQTLAVRTDGWTQHAGFGLDTRGERLRGFVQAVRDPDADVVRITWPAPISDDDLSHVDVGSAASTNRDVRGRLLARFASTSEPATIEVAGIRVPIEAGAIEVPGRAARRTGPNNLLSVTINVETDAIASRTSMSVPVDAASRSMATTTIAPTTTIGLGG